MGTAATAENMRQLTRLSDKVVFCFDGDRAGREAAWRAVESILPFGGGKVAIEFVLLPQGEDPDSYLRANGTEAFDELLGDAIPLSTFMVQQAGFGLNLDSADGRGGLITALQPLLKRLAAGHYRDLVIAELADAIGMSRSLVEDLVDRNSSPAAAMPNARPDKSSQRSAMRSVMTFILHHPGAVAVSEPPAGLDQFDAPGAALLRRMLEIARQEPEIRTGEFVERFRQDEEQGWIRRLAAADPMPLENESDAPDVLRDSLEQLLARHLRSVQAEALRRRSGGAAPL
jgi:DNA primase